MQVHITLNDGRRITTSSKMRYSCWRLTLHGGFVVKNEPKAEELVKWACSQWKKNGFHYLVIDTHTGEAIGLWPYEETSLVQGQTPFTNPE